MLYLSLSYILYVCSHIIRGFRVYAVFSMNDCSLRKAVFIQFSSNSIANFIPIPLIKELLMSLFFLISTKGQLIRIIMSVIYIRIFDMLCILIMAFAFGNEGIVNNRSSFPILFLLFTVFIVASFAVFLAVRICDISITHFIKYHHSIVSLRILALLSSVKKVLLSMKVNNQEKNFIVLLSTFCIWFLEITSIVLYIKFSNGHMLNMEIFVNSLNICISNVLYIFAQTKEMNDLMYHQFYVSLAIFTLIYAIYYICYRLNQRVAARKS